MLNLLVDIIFPRLCNSCQNPLSYGETIVCTRCRHQLSTTAFNFCIENECDRSFYGKTSFKKASALLYFDDAAIAKQLLHQLKYKDQEHLGNFFAHWMAEELKKDCCLPQFDLVVPVPLHWRRKHSRGYNQLHLFTKQLCKLMNWNYNPHLLKRTTHQSSQTTKSRLKRQEDLNPFELTTSKDLTNQNILIIDDLITTGSTLANCSNAIVNNYPCHIYFLSIAYRSRFI